MGSENSRWMCQSVSSFLLVGAMALVARAAEDDLPHLKFFYFDSGQVDWIVSSDKEAFAKHLEQNADSNRFVTSLHKSVRGEEPVDAARGNIADWIADRRAQFEQRYGDSTRFRKAEGVAAYLRAHDFSIRRLTAALKRRTGAKSVDLIAVHQASRQGRPDYKLKVVLTDPTADVVVIAFNVVIQSANASYVPVIYALGLALYEVQERISGNVPSELLPEPGLLSQQRTTEQQPATTQATENSKSDIQKVIYEFE